MTHRYIYDHGTAGSHHEGGLGETGDLDHAIEEAARVDGLGPDCWCGVRDRETGDTIIVSRRALDDGPRLTKRRALTLLREQVSIRGWVRS